MRYAVVVEKAESNFAAYVPDLPGCIATGQTIEETEKLIREAIALHLRGMREDGLVILETRRVEVSVEGITPTEPFNRCKLFVMTRSKELASDVYDREALTRMMAGFYRGLYLGSRLALLTLILNIILSIVLLVCKRFGFECYSNHSFQGVGYVFLISFFSLLFNGSLLIKVADNFRILRMSESDAVFESYLIALSLNSEQA